VDPFGVAVKVTTVPLTKLALQLVEQPNPAGELATVPAPVPAKVNVTAGPVPVKQITFAVMLPVTRAPDECRFPVLLSVVTVAETKALPHAKPVAVNSPVLLTVTISGVFEFQTTWSVMSLVTGGCMKDPRALSCTLDPAFAATGTFEAPKSWVLGWIWMAVSCWSCPQPVRFMRQKINPAKTETCPRPLRFMNFS
jgi:hypothetical protein